jgi:hypothetical protein
LLVELHVAVQTAKAGGATKLPARRLASFSKRYDALVAEGKQLNPPPPRTGKRGRPALGPAGSLLARLATYRTDVLRFATDFRVPFDNNQAEVRHEVARCECRRKEEQRLGPTAIAQAGRRVRERLGRVVGRREALVDVVRGVAQGTTYVGRQQLHRLCISCT